MDTLVQMSHFVSRQSAYQVVGGILRGIMGTFSTAVLKSTKLKHQAETEASLLSGYTLSVLSIRDFS